MVRKRIFILKQHYDKVITFLGEFGVMQIEQLESGSRDLLSGYAGEDRELISRYSQRMRSLKVSLNKRKETSMNIRGLRRAMLLADRIKIDARLNLLHRERDLLEAQRKDAESMLSLLNRLIGFSGDLSILNNEEIESFIISKGGFSKQSLASFYSMSSRVSCGLIKVKDSFIVSISREDHDTVMGFFDSHKLNAAALPRLKGSLNRNIKAERRKIAMIEGRLKRIESEINRISDRYYNIISNLSEYFDIEARKTGFSSKIKSTKSVVVIEGWVEESRSKSLDDSLEKITDGNYYAEVADTKEEPPTSMNNPALFKLYEFFIRFYSIPKSSEIDPTIFFGIAFPIFFGLMISDVGYGLFTLLLSFFAVKAMANPHRRSTAGGRLSNFIHTIAGRDALLVLFKAMIPGSMIAIVFGVIFNQYFGFAMPYHPLFSVTKNVMTLLLISGYIGVFMVSFGFILGALDAFFVRDVRRALGRIGWLFASLGIVALGLMVLYRQPINQLNIQTFISYLSAILGFIMVLWFEGTQSLMQIPSVISHILSYMRLVGILLASIILAEVINMGFLSSLSGSIPVLILGILLLIFGQIFNIILALFEAGIQGARLIYVEFFSKFLTGNGRLFKPFNIKRKLTSYIYKNQSKGID
ncbi:MAG: V-type ATPase 116kDa subunit family protein [Candidatus Parvarchaeota archaeon]|nr:hypothetical protein [Candidatus Parvarchaeota archaeon]